LWLPADFGSTFKSLGLIREESHFGSTFTLLEQLHERNRRTFNLPAETSEVSDWQTERSKFDSAARFGLSIFLALAGKAAEHNLPLIPEFRRPRTTQHTGPPTPPPPSPTWTRWSAYAWRSWTKSTLPGA